MRRYILFALLALSLIAVAGATAVPGERPQPLPPEQAKGLIDRPGRQLPAVAYKQQISPQEVPGLSKFQGAKFRLMGYGCWSVTGMGAVWGTWPYEQVVFEDRYWCGYFEGGQQTYRSSNVRLNSPLCSHDGAFEWRVSGGNGYNYTVVRTGGTFHCPTQIPWITHHPSRWQDWHCDTYTWTPCRRTDTS